MKKISINSLIIGVGVGIIISSVVNIIWTKLEDTHYSRDESISLESPDGFLYANDESKRPLVIQKIKKNHKINTKLNSNENPKTNEINDIDNQTYNEVFIPKGLNSKDISNLLQKEGIIEDSEIFNELTAKLMITKELQYGLKVFPKDSTLDKVIKILTEK